MKIYQGVVENRQDPLKLGRCQVRVVGLHTHDKTQLPTDDLPWAYPMQPITSAAMSGIGHAPIGAVEGTVVMIVFMDEPDNQQPVIIGSVGGIPQSKPIELYGRDDDSVILKDEDGNEAQTPVNQTEAAALTPQQQAQNVLQPGMNPTPAAAATPATNTAPATVTTDIPTTPPPDFTTKVAERTTAIKALIAACDKLGIKSREVRCSILACAGGESGFLPQNELYNYPTAERLAQVFSTTFKKNHPDKAEQYANAKKKGMTAYDFFSFVYLESNNGKGLGNRNADDAGKYIGRGLTGITGYNNYKIYGQAIGVDLLANPDLLTTDLTISALASAFMIYDNTKKKFKNVSETANPEYFYAAKRAQGKDADAKGAAERLKYYEYFYGTKTSSSFTEEKSAAPLTPAASDTTTSNTTTNTQPSPAFDSAGPLGFKDPNNKYPLKKFINEPDTNRLARGIKKGTVHPVKDANRALGIPKAIVGDSYDEPASSFNSKYPYNHVLETESGHVQEFDDTPGHERINTYHRKGTFTEIDPNGSEVHHIVGDSYTIVDNNGCIYIRGEYNLTVDGEANIFCRSDANIEVAGDAEMRVGGNYNMSVAKDMKVSVGGLYQVQSGSDMTLQSNANNNIVAQGNLNHQSGGNLNLKAGGNVAAGGVRIDLNSPGNSPGSASTISLAAPAAGAPLNSVLQYLVAPASEGESLFLIETEEEWASPAGQAKIAELEKQHGAPPPVSDEAPATGGVNTAAVASCQIVQGTENFTNDFRLSPNFTLGMLIDGGINGQNKLRDQNGLTKQQIVCNLAQLCLNIYEPMLAILPGGIGGYGKQWKINSGYRISSNVPAGGVAKSDHMLGRATDFTLLPYDNTKAERNFNFCSQIEKILPYDQIIMEYMSGGSNWIHVGYRGIKEGDTSGGGVNRKMAFTMSNGKTIKRDGFALI